MTQQYVTREEMMEALAPLAEGINRMVQAQERILEGQNLMLEQLGQHTALLQSVVSTLQDHSIRLASIEARLGDT